MADLPASLRRLLPESAAACASTERLDLLAGLGLVLKRAQGSGLCGLALDDLHFADEASVETLQALISEPGVAGLHWLLARRPAEGGAALDRLADQLLDDNRLQPLNLQPLDEAGICELLESLGLPTLDPPALAPELLRSTGGNPLFVLETIKALLTQPDAETKGAGRAGVLPRPASVGALIERRLRQLSPPAQSLARVAALAGPDFSTDLAMHVLQLPLMALADAWSELEAAQVLRDSAFAHDLIYEATLARIPAPIRRHARRAIAEFLAPRDAEPSRLAEHWLAAGEPAQAAPLFEAAGRRAEAGARYSEARSLFEQSAACHAAAGQAEQALHTRLALADLLMEAREFEASQAVLDALVASEQPADSRARIALQQMNVYLRQSLDAQAIEHGQQLLADDDLCDALTPFHLATLRYSLATALLKTGDAAQALSLLQRARPALESAQDPTWQCWFHGQYAVACNQLGQIRIAALAQEAALAAARGVGRRRMLAGVLQNSATIATQAGSLVKAVDMLDECLLLMNETGGDDHFTLFVRAQRARLLAWLGRYAEALQVLEALVKEDSGLEPSARKRAGIALAELWAQIGQNSRAKQALPKLGEAEPSASLRSAAAVARMEIAWLAGQPPDGGLKALRALAGDQASASSVLLSGRAHPDQLDLAGLATLRARWEADGLVGQTIVADVLAACAAKQRADHAAAAEWAGRALPPLRHSLMAGIYRPWLLLEIARCAAPADPALAHRAWQEGTDWVRNVARFHVPEPLRDSFLQRNPINRELLAMPDPAR